MSEKGSSGPFWKKAKRRTGLEGLRSPEANRYHAPHDSTHTPPTKVIHQKRQISAKPPHKTTQRGGTHTSLKRGK